jgi:uncharacterized membrane protein
MMAYGLVIILLATRGAVFSVHFQYPSILYPAVFALVPVALAGLGENRLVGFSGLDSRKLASGLMAGMLVASLIVSARFGGLVPNDSFRAGYVRFQPVPTLEGRAKYAWVEQAVAMIPKGASVSASRNLGPHASNRHSIYRFPAGWGSDYLLVDRGGLNRWRTANLELLISSGAYETLSGFTGRFALLRRVPGADLPERIPRR